jgi:hypothetical protein
VHAALRVLFHIFPRKKLPAMHVNADDIQREGGFDSATAQRTAAQHMTGACCPARVKEGEALRITYVGVCELSSLTQLCLSFVEWAAVVCFRVAAGSLSPGRVPPRQAGNFFLLAQKKVTKKEGLNTDLTCALRPSGPAGGRSPLCHVQPTWR